MAKSTDKVLQVANILAGDLILTPALPPPIGAMTRLALDQVLLTAVSVRTGVSAGEADWATLNCLRQASRAGLGTGYLIVALSGLLSKPPAC